MGKRIRKAMMPKGEMIHIGDSPSNKKLIEERKALRLSSRFKNEKKNKAALITLRNLEVSVIEVDDKGNQDVKYRKVHSHVMCIYIYSQKQKEWMSKGYIPQDVKEPEEKPKKRLGRPKKIESKDKEETPVIVESKPSVGQKKRGRPPKSNKAQIEPQIIQMTRSVEDKEDAPNKNMPKPGMQSGTPSGTWRQATLFEMC